ncbi:MAG TPA: sigma-70 family RNA polymerase sigma factor [Candidatus Nitrosotalea sp.]|nr:sigma-70 family RNA polymerase sigma factor [Candidatus Nitrosotalea sp.]
MRDGPLEEAFARHDETAFETAYRLFFPRMLATALRLLRDREAAKECVHDVFLHLWKQKTAYVTARGSLEAFLVTCARNRALTRIRGGERAQQAMQRFGVPEELPFEEDPIERERIERAISQLSDGQAAVIRLAYYRALTLSEAAAELAIPIGTVKGRLSAALRSLRQALIPENGHGI